jgi:hypothetical protein
MGIADNANFAYVIPAPINAKPGLQYAIDPGLQQYITPVSQGNYDYGLNPYGTPPSFVFMSMSSVQYQQPIHGYMSATQDGITVYITVQLSFYDGSTVNAAFYS